MDAYSKQFWDWVRTAPREVEDQILQHTRRVYYPDRSGASFEVMATSGRRICEIHITERQLKERGFSIPAYVAQAVLDMATCSICRRELEDEALESKVCGGCEATMTMDLVRMARELAGDKL